MKTVLFTCDGCGREGLSSEEVRTLVPSNNQTPAIHICSQSCVDAWFTQWQTEHGALAKSILWQEIPVGI